LQVERSLRESAAAAIDTLVFYLLLALIVLTAIPYGAVEPWWKSLFQSLVFVLAALSLVGKLLKPDQSPRDYSLFLPVLALVAFAFVQTVPLNILTSNSNLAGNSRTTISADVFQTRQFIVHVVALMCVGWLLITHTNTQKRLRQLVEVVIAVGTVCALFGLWRHAVQREPGFVLPYLRPGFGYAQFINPNHFPFLMELALGLALGIVVCRGVTGKRLAIYLAAAIPMWVAVVLANSRGGILSILCQVLFLALLFGTGRESRGSRESHGRSRGLASRLLRASRTLAARGLLVVALLAGAITTVVLVGGDPLVGRVDSIAGELDRKTADTFTLRPSIWRATLKLIKDHPVAGVGFGGYWIAITKYHAASGETTPQEAHNDYLELLASGGIIGLAIGFWFVLALIRTARRKLARLRSADVADTSTSFVRAAALGALTGIMTVAIHSLVDFGLHIPINALIFTVLVAIVAMNVQEDEKTQSPRRRERQEG
jgi:O-antigen ligase